MQKQLALCLALLATLAFSTMAYAADVVNINKASAAAIQQNLVGIGPIKAEAIISYRKKNGKYKSLDDLQNVTGIGPALVKKNKRYLSLSKGVVAGDDKAYAAAKKQAGTGKTKSKSKTAKKTSSSTAKKTDKAKNSTAKKAKKSTDNVAAKPAKKDKTKKSASKTAKKAKSTSKTKKKPAAKPKTTAKKKKKKKAKPAS